MLRPHYIGLISPANSRIAWIAASLLALPGCSMSVPMLGGGKDAPAVTGSLATPVMVQQPLPQTLAYSDATKIGQTAMSAVWQVEKGQADKNAAGGGEWINSATGSSGTIETGTAGADGCRAFNTMVTSIGGVHRYSGQVCRAGNGSPTVRIETPGPKLS